MNADPETPDVWTVDDGSEVICLRRWKGTWDPDDRHANFKSDVVAYGLLDPLVTVRGMSRNLDIPVGASCATCSPNGPREAAAACWRSDR